MRKNLILHKAQLDPINDLNFEQKGKLFEAIIQYQFEGKEPDLSDILQMAFRFIKNQLDIDNQKYEAICKRNRNNGIKGGRPKEPKKPSGLSGNPKNPDEPKKADNDNDNDNDNDLKKNIKEKSFVPPSFKEFEKYFIDNGFDSKLANRAFEGYKVANWHDSEGKQIKNWKQKCQHVWFKDNNKPSKPTNGINKESQMKVYEDYNGGN